MKKSIKLFLLLIILPVATFAATTATFEAGKDFQELQAPSDAAKNQVTEFFSYGCHYCFQLEPYVEKWVKSKGDSIQFKRIPVVFRPSWKTYAKAYYVASALDVESKITPELFNAIQKKRQDLNSSGEMVDFFVSQGVDKAQVTAAFAPSPTMESLLKNGVEKMQAYRINGVPAFIVGGKYKTDLQMAKTPDRLIQILDYLLKKN